MSDTLKASADPAGCTGMCAALPPTPPPAAFDAVVEGIDAPSADIRIIRLRLNNNARLAYRAGQYADLAVAGLPARSYSIANAPDANGTTDHLEFHIRNTGGAASQHVATQLKIGDTATITAPMGHATLAPGCVKPIIAIAGGMGLSPMKAIVESALNTGHPGPITLYWGANYGDDLYIADHFRALQTAHPTFRFVSVVRDDKSRPADAQAGMVGDVVIHDHADLSGASIYVAGPPPMVSAILPQLLAHNAQRGDIHTDDSSARAGGLGRQPAGTQSGGTQPS
ncbi:FAD-binding oxidoreductase [Micavibrio aeruginosavorus]|uniref:FAD-binding oxidoreductase n=1 Tax=Micavibrio aeruginosavorus TaxID=349221 RepID=UPI003F4AA715